MSLLANVGHAGLSSSYSYDLSNTFVSVDGLLNGPPQPMVTREDAESSSTGELLSFEGSPLGIGVGDGVDGAGTVGPSPTVLARAEATGRDFRVAAGLDYDSSSCSTPPNCVFVDASATWQLRWNARAATLSEDTIVIDVPGFEGVAGEFTLPIEITGSNLAESNLLAPTLLSETGFTVATADANGDRTGIDSFRYVASNRSGGNPSVIDTQADFVVPFVVGEEFSLVAAFVTDVSVLTPSILTSDLTDILVEGDFFNTAHFNPFENFRLDSSGNGLFDTDLDVSTLSISSLLNVDYLALGENNGGGDNGGGGMDGGGPVLPPVAVPEPSTIWLSALGCLALLRIRRCGSSSR